MSTRRARIKAVAALPPRRKNQENTDSKSNTKDDVFEKNVKSPRTPPARRQAAKTDAKSSPAKTLRSPPPLIPLSLLSKPNDTDNLPSPTSISSPKEVEISTTSPSQEKVSVCTSSNVFASPQVKGSPDRRRTASPLIVPDIVPSKPSISTETPPKISTPVKDKNNHNINACTPSRDKKSDSDIPDDYSVPSVPESITDESGIDGIVPLQSAKQVSKPIDQMKSEIISECAEVTFDPIVPLPSPSKVRPKLRPVPRLAPHRRNSIQGSASESEDETRRALLNSGAAPPRQRHDSHASHSTIQSAPNREVNRIRNDSISSGVSVVATQPQPATSPVKEKHFSNKSRRQEMGRRSWCRRTRDVKRDALTMYDLIFYNPTTNPIVPDQDEISAKEANAKEEAERNAKAQESEEDADDPPPANAAPVPQIKLGPNGEIILDEQSLVIKQSGASRKVSMVVHEGSWAGSGSGRYTRAARTAEWCPAETVRFYRALAAVGTDFTLMAPLFPDRKRRDLYLKFKKEERHNGAQVDKALRTATAWDPAALQAEFTHERAEARSRVAAERQELMVKRQEERARVKQAKEQRIRMSKGAKAVETNTLHSTNYTEMTGDDFIRRAQETHGVNPKTLLSKRKRSEFTLPTIKPKRKITPPSEVRIPGQKYATLSLVNKNSPTTLQNKSASDLATLSRIDPSNIQPKQVCLNEVAGVPSNVESGSLVVLRVNDPDSPTKTMLQTYIALESGKLTPVSLPPTLLNSVVGYMKKGTTPKSTVSSGSSPLPSPSSVGQDSRSCTPGVIQVNPSPSKKKRHSSFSITHL